MPKIDELKQFGTTRVQLTDLPSEFEGTLLREEFREDARGRECLYWYIDVPNKGTVTQKFTSMHISALVEALQQLKIEDTKDIINKKILFRQKSFRIGNQRWLPVEVRS
jgi:hypothetical protein